jgi:hypothetical protein
MYYKLFCAPKSLDQRWTREEESICLAETAKSQARLIEAVSSFDKKYCKECPFGTKQSTLNQIRESHSRYEGFGATGEFTLGEKENGQIVFLLSHRHYDLENLKPVPWKSAIAEPMQLALSGKSGNIIGLDYRGEKVIAAYETSCRTQFWNCCKN